MANEQKSPDSAVADLARRAAGIARNSHLLGINVRELSAELLSEPDPNKEVAILQSVFSVEHTLNRGAGEEPGRLRVRARFNIKARSEQEGEDLFRLSVTFLVDYMLNPGMPTEDEKNVEAFANSNTLVHVWPYYRELVQSTTWRMGLPPFPLPLFRVGTDRGVSGREDTKLAAGTIEPTNQPPGGKDE